MVYSWNIIGHEKELNQLESDLVNDNLYHSYLFVGPSNVGKFRVAQTLAGILQCPNNYCHNCPACIQVEKKTHPDTIELDDPGESIKIAEVRDLINRLMMTGQSRYKVLAIANIGRLTEEAANCLLKILEEPPPRTIFIFTADQITDVLPTILSRMRLIYFRKQSDACLKKTLGERYGEVAPDTLQEIVTLSLGRSGMAVKLLQNPEHFQEMRDLYRDIQILDEKASISTRMLSLQTFLDDPKKLSTFLSLLVLYTRQALLNETTYEGKRRRIELLQRLHKSLNLMDRNINTRLLLEDIMLNW